jgi:signal transduction histidine kinase/ActR/RegA family two-component response regulator
MARGVRNQLAVYMADLFAVAGAALMIPDGLALLRGVSTGRAPVVADLILVASGLVAHRIALAAHREAPAIALTCLVLGSLAVVWLTERWWVPTAAGAAAAAVAPQFLVSRRALVWGAAGALLGLSGIVAGITTALVASASVAAVGVVSFRLATQLRGAASRTAVELERMFETERMQTAEVLARLNRLESRGRAGTRRSVLRTALTRRLSVVQAISQTIARDLRRSLSGAQSAEIEAAAHRNAERAEQLAQLAAGGEARERETTLSLVWSRVRDNLRSDVAAGIHFDVSLPEGLPPVAGGTEEWAQILAAVVENALDAMPGGGVVKVQAGASERPGHARITVEDSGQGIPPDVLPHVLEPFYTSRAERGAEGLGLAMVASLVEALDGEVQVMSAPGSGTKVEIEVPFYAAALRSNAAEQFRLEGTVLVADDDREVRESLGRLLESFGLETLEVDSGTVALAHLNARPDRFRAAILDVVMAGTPVSDVVVQARVRQPGFPFLLVSGLATARLVDNLLALGGVRFLQKPFTREELFYALRDLLTVERPPVT